MVNPVEYKPELGLPDEQQRGVVSIFNILLADEHVLYTRLRNYHWNVTGPHFHALHTMFEDQYTQLADLIDQIAETIRQYGAMAPGTMEEFGQLARLKEQAGVHPNARTMVANLVADHEMVIRCLREDIETVDDEADDVGAEALLTDLLLAHQKMAWMLRTYLEAEE